MNIPVLMYHRVRSSSEARKAGRGVVSDFVVSEDTLKKQLGYLAARGYRTPDVNGALVDEGPAAKRVLLTFDDGYLDNYVVALPILRALGLTATVFVLANASQSVNFWDANPPTGRAALMGPSEIRAMSEEGIAIGSHGITHRRLDTMRDEEARREIVDSKAQLEDLIGKPVDTFAYPFGAVTQRVKAHVREAGYRAAFAVNSGPFDFHGDAFEIRRVLVADHADERYLYAKVSGLEKAARSTSDIWRGLFSPAPRSA